MNLKHSVLVITYRQEAFIGSCLDSILSQSTMPYEVIIADDCSPDGTWDIVQQYATRYPRIIRTYRNEHNLGVFGNFNQLISKFSGDLINIIAGDDMLPQGILGKYDQFVAEKGLDCRDPFVIYTNSIVLKPDGSRIFKNNRACFREDMFEVGTIHCMWSWDTGMSAGLLETMQHGIRLDLGYQADLLWHIEKIVNSERSYFMDEVGYVYRANAGVSVATGYKEHLESKRKVVSEIYRQYPEKITPRIRRYFEFDDSWLLYNAVPSWKTYWNFIGHYVRFGHFPHGSIHRNPLKVLLPIWAKRMLKKMSY